MKVRSQLKCLIKKGSSPHCAWGRVVGPPPPARPPPACVTAESPARPPFPSSLPRLFPGRRGGDAQKPSGLGKGGFCHFKPRGARRQTGLFSEGRHSVARSSWGVKAGPSSAGPANALARREAWADGLRSSPPARPLLRGEGQGHAGQSQMDNEEHRSVRSPTCSQGAGPAREENSRGSAGLRLLADSRFL